MTLHTIKVPGSMSAFFFGSDPGHGKPDSETGYIGGHELYLALSGTKSTKAGNGYYTKVDLSDDALNVLAAYAGVCLVANSDEPDAGEVRAAKATIGRVAAIWAVEAWKVTGLAETANRVAKGRGA